MPRSSRSRSRPDCGHCLDGIIALISASIPVRRCRQNFVRARLGLRMPLLILDVVLGVADDLHLPLVLGCGYDCRFRKRPQSAGQGCWLGSPSGSACQPVQSGHANGKCATACKRSANRRQTCPADYRIDCHGFAAGASCHSVGSTGEPDHTTERSGSDQPPVLRPCRYRRYPFGEMSMTQLIDTSLQLRIIVGMQQNEFPL
jgi:hypothetical protein